VSPAEPFDAVILAGGSGRRMGGVDKASLLVGGLTLLDRVLLASAGARRTVVVGEARATVRAVEWTLEQPAGGGPVAGIAAGLQALGRAGPDPAPLLLLLATDLPRMRADDVTKLVEVLTLRPQAAGAVFVDAGGRRQPLAGLYRTEPLHAAVTAIEPVHGKAVKLVVQHLELAGVPDLEAAGDCDTPDQLAAARADLEQQA
jgi:molybdopterin-guanine dinucleotide biosynthesis protein A